MQQHQPRRVSRPPNRHLLPQQPPTRPQTHRNIHHNTPRTNDTNDLGRETELYGAVSVLGVVGGCMPTPFCWAGRLPVWFLCWGFACCGVGLGALRGLGSLRDALGLAGCGDGLSPVTKVGWCLLFCGRYLACCCMRGGLV